MSHPRHFRSRAAAYRQLARESRNEHHAGDMFEIANLFDSIANDLALLLSPRIPRIAGISGLLAWARPARLHQLVTSFKL